MTRKRLPKPGLPAGVSEEALRKLRGLRQEILALSDAEADCLFSGLAGTGQLPGTARLPGNYLVMHRSVYTAAALVRHIATHRQAGEGTAEVLERIVRMRSVEGKTWEEINEAVGPEGKSERWAQNMLRAHERWPCPRGNISKLPG